jgi:predicted amidohydrolase
MSAPQRIRIATAQYPIDKLPDIAAVRDKLGLWVAEAAGTGAQLLVFPEYGAMELAAAAGDGIAADVPASLKAVSDALPEADAIHAELARRHGVHILAASGPVWRTDRYVNAARLITPDGRIGVQEKLIMTPFELDWNIVPGKALRVFETALGRIGIAICYDSEFPLLVRAQAEAGAEMILVPSCTERVSGAHRVRTAALARALENTCAAVVSPTVGDATWCATVDHNAGIAGTYVPAEAGLSDTGILAEGRLNHPGWVYADVDLTALRALRTRGEMRNARDWSLQPGAGALAQHVELVKLV